MSPSDAAAPPATPRPGLIRRLFARLGSGSAAAADAAIAAVAPADAGVTPLRESFGATIDPDEHEWRRLSGNADRDLDTVTHARSLELANFLWRTNLVANRLIELPLAYLLAKGVRLKVDDEQAQDVLDRHWTDGINCWALKLVKRVRELGLFGEQCWPVFVGSNGFVRVGYLDPHLIATVVMDPDNAEQPIGIITKTDRKGDARRYRVIVNAPEDAFTPRTQEIRKTFSTGDCFYFRVNDLCTSTRGASDLLAQIDWLDAYDQFLFGELERADFMRAFVWDVTLKGADEAAVKKRAKEITAPKPGSVRVHNDAETWNAVTPELQSNDGAAAAKLFRNHMLGGATMPEHWYGGAGDVNRATGSSMAEPTEKTYELRQGLIGHMLAEVGRFVLRAHWKALQGEASDEQGKILATVAVEWPEMTSKDTTRYAAALTQVTSAVASAIAEGLMTRASGVALIAAMAAQLGVEIDPEQELQAVEEEQAERGGSALDDVPLETDDPPLDVPPADVSPADATVE